MNTKRLFKCVISFICALALVVTGLVFTSAEVKAEDKPTVYFVGDSTVCAFDDAYYYPRYGYGTQLENYLDGSYAINNLALSGRSSLSFLSEANYSTLKSSIKAGDVLIVGFGHNDEKTEADRYTNPNGDYKTAGSFAKTLYDNYVKIAKDAGAEVILCTPIVRRAKGETFTNSEMHITSASGSYEGGDYPQAIRDLGKAVNVPVVDLTKLTKELYETIGADQTQYMHAWTSSKPASLDPTHLNIYGAKKIAYVLAGEIKKTDTALAAHVKLGEEPTKDKDLVTNPNYKEVSYETPTVESKVWSQAGIWSGSFFGDNGGVDVEKDGTKYVTLSQNDNGDINIAVTGNKGKIASATDAFAMYYYMVPVGSNFTLTAKAKVNSFTSNDQVSFGLIARDDMYIDSYVNTTMGDYVAAAPLKLSKAGSQWNCFARKSGALIQGGKLPVDVKAGDEVALKIESNPDGYACTFGDNAAITGGFDFALTSVDSQFVYVGMFATRAADVTFSDVKLVIDGVEITTANAKYPKDYASNTDSKEDDKKEDTKPEVKPEDTKKDLNLQWDTVDGKSYWYENGVKQGTVDDKQSFIFEGTIRGREIFDAGSNGWYWLDACFDGAKAVDKEVFMPYVYSNELNMSADEVKNVAILSKFSKNDKLEDGTVIPNTYDMSAQIEKTIKAHQANPDSRDGGKWVRYDAKGAMIKGWYTADASLYPAQKGNCYFYDYKTGLMAKGILVIDGVEYKFDEVTGVCANPPVK